MIIKKSEFNYEKSNLETCTLLKLFKAIKIINKSTDEFYLGSTDWKSSHEKKDIVLCSTSQIPRFDAKENQRNISITYFKREEAILREERGNDNILKLENGN